MTKFNTIPVVFDQEAHTYTNTDTWQQYVGITSTLMARLFPDKYAGIPTEVLEKAAERGSIIHETIELVNTLGIVPSNVEAQNYIKLAKEYGLKHLASEWTVSDMEYYATNIDAIYEVEENVVDIADFKTTSKLDREYVSWQLSIGAFLLEKNNPHVKVRKLYAIWLRGEIAEIVEVNRRTDDEVLALMQADIEDKPYEYKPFFPDYISENEMALFVLGKKIKELTDEYEAIKADVLAKMEEQGDKSFDTGNVLITYVAPQKRESFDSKRFREENAEIYGKYMKMSETKPSLKLTLR